MEGSVVQHLFLQSLMSQGALRDSDTRKLYSQCLESCDREQSLEFDDFVCMVNQQLKPLGFELVRAALEEVDEYWYAMVNRVPDAAPLMGSGFSANELEFFNKVVKQLVQEGGVVSSGQLLNLTCNMERKLTGEAAQTFLKAQLKGKWLTEVICGQRCYSGTSEKGPSEKGTTFQQGTSFLSLKVHFPIMLMFKPLKANNLSNDWSFIQRFHYICIVALLSALMQNAGRFSAGPRFILELRPFISEICGEEIPLCHMCKEPVIQGQQCGHCEAKIHLVCVVKLAGGRRAIHCPGCHGDWLQDIPNITLSHQPSMATTSDPSTSASGPTASRHSHQRPKHVHSRK